ncbi:methyltransferase [Hoeflea sp.]|uniref:methyltransferase n=1 Tax=Hoeflea sp. TaxID=1940281 RepID=UPI003B016CA6
MPTDAEKAFDALSELLVGAKVAFMLRAMADLRIADELAHEGQTADALAQKLGLAADPLKRVMRALTQFGVFEELPDGRFANTPMSEYLRGDTQPSLRDAFLFLNHDVSLMPWLKIGDTLKDGASRFNDIHGGPLFSLFAKDQELADHFARCMRNLYGTQGGRIAAGYPFSRYSRLIDVGGGQGHVLAAILAANPEMKGTLFDIEATAPLARDFFAGLGLDGRTEVIGGDFFIELPGDHDAYMVKSVLHDWDDDKAVAILETCRAAMPQDADLLIVDSNSNFGIFGILKSLDL